MADKKTRKMTAAEVLRIGVNSRGEDVFPDRKTKALAKQMDSGAEVNAKKAREENEFGTKRTTKK